MSEPLKPCPFCGGEPEIGHVNEDEWGAALDEIRCVACQCGGLRAGWQMRAAPALSKEVREAATVLIEESLPDCIRFHDPDEPPCESCAHYEAARATLRSFLAVSTEGQK